MRIRRRIKLTLRHRPIIATIATGACYVVAMAALFGGFLAARAYAQDWVFVLIAVAPTVRLGVSYAKDVSDRRSQPSERWTCPLSTKTVYASAGMIALFMAVALASGDFRLAAVEWCLASGLALAFVANGYVQLSEGFITTNGAWFITVPRSEVHSLHKFPSRDGRPLTIVSHATKWSICFASILPVPIPYRSRRLIVPFTVDVVRRYLEMGRQPESAREGEPLRGHLLDQV
jgi:hypothetical protein